MIFVDVNVPMYLVGADGRHKWDAQRILERLANEQQRLVTDAEVFQEILHRYVAIARREFIQPAFDIMLALVHEVFPVEKVDVVQAKDLLANHPRLSPRDALHAAVMLGRGVETVLTFDRGFDAVAGLRRVPAG